MAHMHEFDSMEAPECIDLNDVDVEEYGYQISMLLGSNEKDIYGREVYQSKKLLDSLEEENAKQDVDSI